MLEKIIREKLEQKFPGDEIEIMGDFAEGSHLHLQVKVVSEKFKNLTLLQQHALINEALADLLKSQEIHALKIKTIVK